MQKAECEYAGFFASFTTGLHSTEKDPALISVGDLCNCKDGIRSKTFRGEKKRVLQVIYLKKKNSHETKTVHVVGWKRVYCTVNLDTLTWESIEIDSGG